MLEKRPAVLVVSPGPALRWAMRELNRRHNYRLVFASDPYEAGLLLENTSVDAVVCEVAPAYSRECRLLHEICHRSPDLPVFLFVEPEGEDYLFDELAHGAFQVIRPTMPLDEFHRILRESIERRQRRKVA